MLQDILTGMSAFASTTAARNRRKRRRASVRAKEQPPGTGDFRLDALNRVLSSPHFRASERNKRFLKFVVEETVAGRAERIKAFTVAVDVFGRDSSFDASVDPIVRIAAGHLRRSLHDYYASQGAADPVRICLPIGTYVPDFVQRETMPQRALGQLGRLVSDRRRRLQSGAVGAAVALAAAAAALAYISLGPQALGPQKPVLVVDSARPHAQGGSGDALAHLLTQSLLIALSGEDGIRIVGVRREEKFGEVLARTKGNFAATVPLYQLLTSVRADGAELHAYWHLLDGRSSETYLSASAVEGLVAEQPDAAPGAVAQAMVTSLKSRLLAPPSQAAARREWGGLPWGALGWK